VEIDMSFYFSFLMFYVNTSVLAKWLNAFQSPTSMVELFFV